MTSVRSRDSGSSLAPFQPDLRFGSNAVRLSLRQWLIVAAVLVLVFALTPVVWKSVEPFHPDADYRVPFELSSDYWLFRRHADLAASQGKTLVLGDSVIWGDYVTKAQTLSHYLNEEAGQPRFANLGVNGLHPVALAGLLEYYGESIAGKDVLLHCNLLWTASKERDLQTRKEVAFNHPGLVPQFWPRIPCYGESSSGRIGNVVDRYLPFSVWVSHLRQAHFEAKDLPTWTLDHPYANPLKQVKLAIPPAEGGLRHEPMPWTERGGQTSFDWVDLDTSLQWRFFRQAVATLQRRGNRVFVLVGPFNEHMLKEPSLAVYADRKKQVQAWLRENRIPHYAPPALPSELCADASHPLAAGYALLARMLTEDEGFRQFQGGNTSTQ